MNPWALAACAAATIASFDTPGVPCDPYVPYAMLFAIVSSNSTVSCVTIPICDRSEARDTSRISVPSMTIDPVVTS